MSHNTMDTDVSVAQGTNRVDSIAEKRAKRLLARVARGETLSNAANAERMSVAEINAVDSPVRASLQQLIGTYFLPPEARKQMVRAGLNKLFIDNVSSEDPAAQKLALDAAKQIGADPEVGLTQEVVGGVVINIGELEGVFAQLKTAPVPEVSLGREPREDRVVEAEFYDLPDGGSEPASVSAVPDGPGTGAETAGTGDE